MKKLNISSVLILAIFIVFISCARERPPAQPPSPQAPPSTPAQPAPIPAPIPTPPVEVLEITSAISDKTSYSHLIPDSTPVISTNMSHVMRGEFNFLSIYVGGEIVYIEEKGLRLPSPEPPPMRTWKTGKLRRDELDSLLDFIKSSGFKKLNNYYKFPGKPTKGGGFSMGDMDYKISVNDADLHQIVQALGYLTPDQGLTYPDMPHPLNEIYQKLRDISINSTQEVAQETIAASLMWK